MAENMKRLQELQDQSEAMEEELRAPEEDYILREDPQLYSFQRR